MLSMQKNVSKPFYMLLSLPSTAMGFALSIQIAALSWLLSTQYGLDIHEIGIVWAAGPIAGIIGQVLIGFISDNVWLWNGRRRPFILIGGFLAAMSLLALPNIGIISDSLGIESIMAVAIAVALTLDLAINISFNPTRSIIADVTQAGKPRTHGYTWMQTISGSFGVLAYFIGAELGNVELIYVGVFIVLAFSLLPPFFITEPKTLKPESTEIQQQNTFSLTTVLMDIKPLWGFLLYSIYAATIHLTGITFENQVPEVFAFIVTLYFVFDTLNISDKGKSATEANHINFKKILAAHSFSWIGVQTMFIFTFAFLQDTMPQLDSNQLGSVINYSFLALNLVGAILPALVLAPLADRFGRIKTHSYALASMSFAYLLISFIGHTPTAMFILMAMAGVGWAAIISLPFAIMSERVEQTKMGLHMGLFNLSVVLPQLVVSLGISLFLNKTDDKRLVFIVCAISLAISAIAWMMIKEPPKLKNS